MIAAYPLFDLETATGQWLLRIIYIGPSRQSAVSTGLFDLHARTLETTGKACGHMQLSIECFMWMLFDVVATRFLWKPQRP